MVAGSGLIWHVREHDVFEVVTPLVSDTPKAATTCSHPDTGIDLHERLRKIMREPPAPGRSPQRGMPGNVTYQRSTM